MSTTRHPLAEPMDYYVWMWSVGLPEERSDAIDQLADAVDQGTCPDDVGVWLSEQQFDHRTPVEEITDALIEAFPIDADGHAIED